MQVVYDDYNCFLTASLAQNHDLTDNKGVFSFHSIMVVPTLADLLVDRLYLPAMITMLLLTNMVSLFMVSVLSKSCSSSKQVQQAHYICFSITLPLEYSSTRRKNSIDPEEYYFLLCSCFKIAQWLQFLGFY